MIWANSANTQVGDTKIFNNMGKSFVLVEATENGYVEVESGSYDELRSIYEQTYRKTTNKVYEHSKVLQSEQGRDFFDLFNDENRTNVGRYSEKIGEERFQNDTSRNNEYLQSSDKEKFSLKTNYLREIAMKNKNEDETPFKTGNSQKTTPSDISSSKYSLLNKLQMSTKIF